MNKMLFQENIGLRAYSNFKIGGVARYFFAPKSEEEAVKSAKGARELTDKIFILGGGTNLLISDDGYPGAVIAPQITGIAREGNDIVAGAGVLMGDLLAFAEKEGLSGLEWAGGLPGTLGGAIRGNAGAFKGEIKDSVVSVKSLSLSDQKILERTRELCRFRYRESLYKLSKEPEMILEARLALTPGNPESIKASIKEKIEFRSARHPLEYPNIGSIFKNVPAERFPELSLIEGHIKNDPFPVVPAGFLISEAGLKGAKKGDAMISERHANFIVNTGQATAKDVLELIDLAKEAVAEKFWVSMETEVEGVGRLGTPAK